MFDEQKYINEYNKNNYKCFKYRVRKDEDVLIKHLLNKKNLNKYITSLIWKDIFETYEHNFINNDIKIDFELSKTMQNLVERAEKADFLDDYGLYMNLADAIDSQAKKETTHHQMRESDWIKLTRRYCLW